MSRFLPPAEFIARHGTESPPWSAEDARAYTRWLAKTRYENFNVVSLLLPRALHQDFYNVYGFCRWADDLGDELGDPQRSLELLGWWRRELDEMYAGRPRHPVYVALAGTVATHGIPAQPFADLIHAFVQDQAVTHYDSYEELLGYCRYSANPVGRLVLHLCGYTDTESRDLSDSTCTALQLANFWQDVRRDWRLGRVYLPLDVMGRHDYSIDALAEDVRRGLASKPFRRLLQDLVERSELLFEKGLPLVELVDSRLAVDVALFSRGGIAILDKIRRQGFDVIRQRPVLGSWDRFRLLFGALVHYRWGGSYSQPLRRHRQA